MPPAFALALGLMGAVAVVRWCVKEVRRVNAELDHLRDGNGVAAADRGAVRTLKRDPETGEYRPG